MKYVRRWLHNADRALGSEIAETLALGLPIGLALVAQSLMALTDLAIISRLGVNAVAGVSLALSVYTTAMLFGLGIVTAVAPVISQAHGSGDVLGVKAVTGQGLWLAILASMPAFLLVNSTYGLLIALHQRPELARIASDYNRGAVWGLPAFICYINFRCFMSAVGQPRPTTWIMFSAVGLNAFLGYVLTLGCNESGGLGVFGAGVASSLVRLCILVLVISILMRARSFDLYKLFDPVPRPDWREIARLFWLGIPIGVRIVLAEGLLPILALLVGSMGTEQLAAHTVALRVAGFTSVLGLALSSAASSRVGWNVGRADFAGARRAGWTAVMIAVTMTAGASASLALFRRSVARIFFSLGSEAVLHVLVNTLVVVSAYQLINVAQIVLVGSLLGLSDTKMPTAIVLLGTWGIGLGGAAFFARVFHMQVPGLWLGLTVGVASVFVMSARRFQAKTAG